MLVVLEAKQASEGGRTLAGTENRLRWVHTQPGNSYGFVVSLQGAVSPSDQD